MKNITQLTLSTIILFTLAACQESSVRITPAQADGVLKEGQSIPIVTRKNTCGGKVALSKRKFRSITSRDKRRFAYDYVNNIRSSITSKWNKPSSTTSGASCTVQIKQRIDGCVRSIKFTQCAQPRMRKSVKDAIAIASPLPRAPHPSIYDDTIEISFKN